MQITNDDIFRILWATTLGQVGISTPVTKQMIVLWEDGYIDRDHLSHHENTGTYNGRFNPPPSSVKKFILTMKGSELLRQKQQEFRNNIQNLPGALYWAPYILIHRLWTKYAFDPKYYVTWSSQSTYLPIIKYFGLGDSQQEESLLSFAGKLQPMSFLQIIATPHRNPTTGPGDIPGQKIVNQKMVSERGSVIEYYQQVLPYIPKENWPIIFNASLDCRSAGLVCAGLVYSETDPRPLLAKMLRKEEIHA